MWELAAVGHDLVELRDVEPLERKVVDERLRALVGEHAVDLLSQHTGVAEALRFGKLEQLLIRHAAPEEERHARRELEIAQAADARPFARFRAIDEVRAREHGRHSVADAGLEAVARA